MLAADLRLALDPVAFATDALGFAPDPWQARTLRSNSKRALWNVARQCGKSSTAAILSLHRALFYPSSLVLLVSPSLRQSSELFRRVTDLLAKLDARPELREDNRLSCTLANSSRIVSLPSSEATIRGFSGASLIVEDEAARVPDDLYRSVRPMLAVSGGRLILMSTPFGRRGHFFEEWTNGGEAWERVQVRASECPRISAQFLQEERASLGPWWYEAEYECRFQDAQTSAFGYDAVMGATKEEVESWKL
jgi:hypothetical protein